MANFNEHELNLINENLEPTFWSRKFSKQSDDVKFVNSILERAGL